ncbi:hypothetical protein CKO38_03330 [Rhodospirillum rubrum]|uniref:DUF2336 domain-containing protein n=1 Tax=Rhodospirillum rubrum TaxID=1085 RepID=UPI0019036EB6|nr:DUF2336 domain-containing protein [Rhodospirillum rubrum]MBK1663112.1 hypothetical protein [Rhodospirillum rubrum]MBK1675723.1 hypothetical protein [Rhodospirillum rubrum]
MSDNGEPKPEEDSAPSQHIDAEALLKLAREKTVSSRNRLAEAMVDLFSARGRVLTERERTLMVDILKRVLREIEHSVRKRISNDLAERSDAPHALISFLANEDIDISFPILSQSRVLQDADLIEVIRNRTFEHQLAIAVRFEVSPQVSAALVQSGDATVITELLRNPDARISAATMDYLVEQSRRVDTFQEPILRRRDLPPDVAKRMFMWVSAALRKYIVTQFDLDPDSVDDLLEKAAHDGIETTLDERGPQPAAVLADTLFRKGDINAELLISSLHDGEVALFIELFARMSGMRPALVQRMLFEPGGEGLAIACKALDFSREDFSVLFLLSRQARPTGVGSLRETHVQVMEVFDRIALDDARRVLRRWQRDQDYLKALLSLESEASAPTLVFGRPASSRPFRRQPKES